jgi:hypothetical protein
MDCIRLPLFELRNFRLGVQMGVQTAGNGPAAGEGNVGRLRVLSGFVTGCGVPLPPGSRLISVS